MNKVCGYHLSPSNYSMETLSVDCCEGLLVRPMGGSKQGPKGGEIDILKPENVKFPVGCPLVHLGANH